MLESLQSKVNTVAAEARAMAPECPHCGQPMSYHDTRPVSWLAHWGRRQASPSRYRCSPCKQERRPLLDLLGVEPGRICGWLARRLGLLAAVAPYELAARLAQLLLGVTISAMGVWRVTQRLGQAAARLQRGLESVSRRQPECGRCGGERAPGGGSGNRWLHSGNAGPHAPSPESWRRTAARFADHRTRSFPRGEDRRSAAAQRTRGNLAWSPIGGPAIPGHLLGRS